MDEPYNKIQELPIMIEKYNNKLLDLYEDEAENIRPILETYKNEVMIYLDQFDFAYEFKTIYSNKFSELLEKLNNAKQFNTILAMPQMSERTKNNCIAEINREVEIRKPKKEEDKPRQVEDSKPEKPKQTRMVSKTHMMPHQPVVSSVDDIETILRDMRTRLEKELNDNGEFKLI
ncbi:hypothetical protein LEQ06_04280 [Paraclostridium sp. AKS46]|nr:hypothetical protein [Paraclostridium sp. AKS46]